MKRLLAVIVLMLSVFALGCNKQNPTSAEAPQDVLPYHTSEGVMVYYLPALDDIGCVENTNKFPVRVEHVRKLGQWGEETITYTRLKPDEKYELGVIDEYDYLKIYSESGGYIGFIPCKILEK